jgi:phage baseplate assembly protein W
MSTRLLSDKNSTDYLARPVSRKRSYSDFDGAMNLHPIRNDLVSITDTDAVRQSIRNLILTNHYEVPFAPLQGGNLASRLFEPVSRFTILDIEDAIRSTIQKYEPRVDDVTVIANDNGDRNEYIVTVYFRIISTNVQTELNFNLERVR